MKLSELYTMKDVEVAFPTGRSLNIKYDPSALTPKLEAELNGTPNGNQVAALVSQLVVEWDLEDNGVTVSLDEESVRAIPLVVTGLVLRAITADIAESTRAEGNS